MSRQRSVPSGRMWKILVVCLALVALAVALPAAVLAATGEGKVATPRPSAPDASLQALTEGFHTGDWTQTEPWASLLTGGAPSSGLRTSAVPPVLFFDDMESGSGNWTSTGDWAITEEWYGDSPTHSWSDSPGGLYAPGVDSYVYSRTIDLSAAHDSGNDVFVLFSCDVDTEDPEYVRDMGGWQYYDALRVACTGDGGSSWQDLGVLVGDLGEGYFAAEIPNQYLTDQSGLRFWFFSDSSIEYDGVYIDDVAILSAPSASVEQGDPRLTYLGNWGYSASAAASGGSFNYTTSPGAALNINFTGTGLTLYGKVGPSYGIANVSLDGGSTEEVDFYSPVTSFQEAVYDTGNLSDGAHTLTLTYTGTKNPASTGSLVNVDVLDVWGTLTQAPVPARHQQDDLYLAYTGIWSTTSTSLASGSSFASADAPGSAVNVAFDGTYLAWYATMGPGYGKAQVSLDGMAPVLVDFYSSYTKYKQRVYNTGLLSDKPHTLSIYWIGQKNTAAYGTRINVDAFDVLDDLTGAPDPAPILWRYQQSDTRLTYLGNWSNGATASASGGSFSYAGAKGAAVVVNFTGISVTLLATKGPGYGKAEVCLDGGVPVLVDFYNPTTVYKQPVPITVPTPGPHTLTIKRAEDTDKNPASSGYTISLDALDITGFLTQAPAPIRYQQDDPNFEYMGSWAPTSTSLASGYSFTSVDAPGSALNVTFTGTYLAWYATTGPGYGKAQVSLDGGPSFLVDFYSSYTKYKQRVYNTGLIDDTTSHTLSIYWVGQKNAAAWGTRISVDAFDILGTASPGPDPEPILWRYQQSDSRLAYVGAWSGASSGSASGGSFNYTVTTGAAVVVNFTGTSVNLLATKGRGYGQARVALDGDWSTAELVDFYNPTTLYKQVVYTRPTLAPGTHTLTIKCIGEHQDPSTGNTINLDALDITGYLNPAITRYQEDNAAFAYLPAWTPSVTWSASGGSLRSVNVSGAQVTINFTGQYLAWYAKTAPWYGKATLTLDGVLVPGGLPGGVDLYSATTGWKKLVYNTGLLADDGDHTLVIEWSGLKNTRSGGTTITVDAFDIVGTIRDVTP